MARNFNDFKKENKKRSDKGPISKKKRKEMEIAEYRQNRNGITIVRLDRSTLTSGLL